MGVPCSVFCLAIQAGTKFSPTWMEGQSESLYNRGRTRPYVGVTALLALMLRLADREAFL